MCLRGKGYDVWPHLTRLNHIHSVLFPYLAFTCVHLACYRCHVVIDAKRSMTLCQPTKCGVMQSLTVQTACGPSSKTLCMLYCIAVLQSLMTVMASFFLLHMPRRFVWTFYVSVRGFGRMDGRSPCFGCRSAIFPTKILPPRKRRMMPGPRNRNQHSCLAEDCFNRMGNLTLFDTMTTRGLAQSQAVTVGVNYKQYSDHEYQSIKVMLKSVNLQHCKPLHFFCIEP